jgi:hypothetical protein
MDWFNGNSRDTDIEFGWEASGVANDQLCARIGDVLNQASHQRPHFLSLISPVMSCTSTMNASINV